LVVFVIAEILVSRPKSVCARSEKPVSVTARACGEEEGKVGATKKEKKRFAAVEAARETSGPAASDDSSKNYPAKTVGGSLSPSVARSTFM
jgi:hypothetical protein